MFSSILQIFAPNRSNESVAHTNNLFITLVTRLPRAVGKLKLLLFRFFYKFRRLLSLTFFQPSLYPANFSIFLDKNSKFKIDPLDSRVCRVQEKVPRVRVLRDGSSLDSYPSLKYSGAKLSNFLLAQNVLVSHKITALFKVNFTAAAR